MADRLGALTDSCVHCGFCLPACPTYELSGAEPESPRGRIHLIQQAVRQGRVTASIAEHLDSCLGCLACVPACPSGVRYGEIIDEARALRVDAGPPRDWRERLLRGGAFAVFPYRRRLAALRPVAAAMSRLAPAGRRRLIGLAQRVHPSLGALAELSPPPRPRVPLPPRIPARPGGQAGPARAVVGLLRGCVQSAFFSHVSAATARVLSLEGCEVVVPPRQGCCGALAGHAGRREQARRQAKHTIALFEQAGVEAIVTDAAGCGSAMKEYGTLLRDDPHWAARAQALAGKVRDVTELLVALGEPLAVRHPVPLRVAYHDACHLSHGQDVRAQPRLLLGEIPSLTLLPVADADLCCGSAGLYNVLRPQIAAELGERKAAALRAGGAQAIAAGNPGCLLQISAALHRTGAELPAVHTIELLDASLSGTGFDVSRGSSQASGV